MKYALSFFSPMPSPFFPAIFRKSLLLSLKKSMLTTKCSFIIFHAVLYPLIQKLSPFTMRGKIKNQYAKKQKTIRPFVMITFHAVLCSMTQKLSPLHHEGVRGKIKNQYEKTNKQTHTQKNPK